MIVNKLIYLFIESYKSILRTLIPSIISSLTIAVSLVILSISYYTYENLKSFTADFKDEYKIEVFFDSDLSMSNALDAFNKILLINGIEEGAFIDKEAAATIFMNEFNEDVVEIIGMNPLPMGAIYGVSSEQREYKSMNNIINEIKRVPSVDDVLFSKDAIMKFDKVIRNLLSFSFIVGIFIIIIAIFFVSNTILLIIHSKQQEIRTMQLLGSTDLFIKIPYIINGIALGLLGSFISSILLLLLYKFSIYLIFPYYEMPQFSNIDLLILNLIAGPLLGLIGSARALSSYVNNTK